MAVQDIIAYIRSNEKTFSRETLILRLRQAGYPEEEIQAALNLKNSATGSVPAASIVSTKPVWKKILAWIGGFFVGGIVFGIFMGVSAVLVMRMAFGSYTSLPNYLIGFFAIAVVLMAAAIFIFIRIRSGHPQFSYGLLTATIIFILFLIGSVILYSIVFQSLNSARGKARDARRFADVKQLQLALELYFDANGGYPENLRELQPKFIPVIPRDPVTQIEYIYEKRADGSYYMAATLEDPSARYLQNDINTGNQLYEVSESPGFVTDQGAQSKQALDLGYVLNGRPWGPEQATGAPNSPSILGDHGTAWASLTEDNQDEWLLLSYEKSIMTSAILVYESYNPGALRQIDQVSGERVYTLWQGRDPVMVSKDNRYVARIELGRPIMLSRIRLEIKSIEVQGWNEIDAVGLEDKDGKIYWAAHAEASSSYAEPIPPGG